MVQHGSVLSLQLLVFHDNLSNFPVEKSHLGFWAWAKVFPTVFRLTHMFPKGQRILWLFCFLQYVLIGLHLDHHVLPAILD